MNPRAAVLGGGVLVLLAAAGGLGWHFLAAAPSPDSPETASAALPVPPVPPRLVEGARYEQCLAMLPDDPRGAEAFAEAWTDGGDGATHCKALAEVALGEVNAGADHLERLAAASKAPPAARAAVYEQAVQAWLMAANPTRALAAATAALALTADDADLLIDRAVAAASLNRFDTALDDLSRALDADPRRSEALVLRAAAWRHLGFLELALADVDRALAIDAENAEAMLERGILRQRRDDPAGAREDWQRAIMLAPDTPTADLAEQNLALLEAGRRGEPAPSRRLRPHPLAHDPPPFQALRRPHRLDVIEPGKRHRARRQGHPGQLRGGVDVHIRRASARLIRRPDANEAHRRPGPRIVAPHRHLASRAACDPLSLAAG
jgi:tetratricopeptide (TPR) repeat protein